MNIILKNEFEYLKTIEGWLSRKPKNISSWFLQNTFSIDRSEEMKAQKTFIFARKTTKISGHMHFKQNIDVHELFKIKNKCKIFEVFLKF